MRNESLHDLNGAWGLLGGGAAGLVVSGDNKMRGAVMQCRSRQLTCVECGSLMTTACSYRLFGTGDVLPEDNVLASRGMMNGRVRLGVEKDVVKGLGRA